MMERMGVPAKTWFFSMVVSSMMWVAIGYVVAFSPLHVFGHHASHNGGVASFENHSA
jgi:hypothetical protein